MKLVESRMRIGLVCATLWAVTACGSSDDALLYEPEHTGDAPHWTYEGVEGPEHWGALAENFASCSNGQQQSPIDIPASIASGELSALSFDYAAAPATILDNGHTVQVTLMEGANQLSISGETYSLLQFHFHAHSEHTVAGQAKPLEMHLVHRSAAGGLAVVGVFLDTGAANSALSSIFDTMATATDEPSELQVEVDPSLLLPTSHQGWTYSGSLTTPPCTEGVKWHVLSSNLEVSEEQLEAFTVRHETSHRPVMENSSTVTSGD
jgi:carbonic anhydrase